MNKNLFLSQENGQFGGIVFFGNFVVQCFWYFSLMEKCTNLIFVLLVHFCFEKKNSTRWIVFQMSVLYVMMCSPQNKQLDCLKELHQKQFLVITNCRCRYSFQKIHLDVFIYCKKYICINNLNNIKSPMKVYTVMTVICKCIYLDIVRTLSMCLGSWWSIRILLLATC